MCILLLFIAFMLLVLLVTILWSTMYNCSFTLFKREFQFRLVGTQVFMHGNVKNLWVSFWGLLAIILALLTTSVLGIMYLVL